MKDLYIVTGPAGVGKSTISAGIAERLEKSCLIEGDSIYNMVVGGRVSPWKEGNQLDIFWKNCFSLIENFLNDGYDVVFNYIIFNDDLEKIKSRFKDININFVVLLVDEETIIKRDKLRPEDCQMGERSMVLLNEFKEEFIGSPYVLDTSKQTEEETVNQVFKRVEDGTVEIWRK